MPAPHLLLASLLLATSPSVSTGEPDTTSAHETEPQKPRDRSTAPLEAALQRNAQHILAARTAEELDSLLDNLRDTLGAPAPGGARAQRLQNHLNAQAQLIPSWQRLLLAREAGDRATARAILRDLIRQAAPDALPSAEQIRDYARAHSLAIPELPEATETLDARIKLAAEAALAARKAADLQPHLDALVALRDDHRASSDEAFAKLQLRATDALLLFQHWQDFLATYERGDPRDVTQAMAQITYQTYRQRPVPREQLLARATELRDTLKDPKAASLDQVTWAELPALRAQLIKPPQHLDGLSATDSFALVAELGRLLAARAALDRGEPEAGVQALNSLGNSQESGYLPPPGIVALRQAWWFEALPALTGLPTPPPRQGGEAAITYARRHLDAALESADWPRAHAFAMLDEALSRPGVRPTAERLRIAGPSPVQSISAFLKAEKLAALGQTPAALNEYRRVITIGAPPALEKQALARLESLANPKRPPTPTP